MAEGLQRDIFNQCALKQLDPKLKEVVGFSAFVVIYKFDVSENEWKKTEFEGTLFVYARSSKPTYNILVLNRHSPINFEEPICGELILQRREPFLFYINPKGSLYGIWFHDRGDCLRVTYQIEGIKRQLTAVSVADDEWSDIATFKSLMRMSDSPRDSGRIASGAKKSGNGDGKTSAPSKKPERGRSRIAAQLCPPGDGNAGSSGLVKKPSDEKKEGAVKARGVPEDTTDEDEDQTPKSVVDFFAQAGFAPINPQPSLRPVISHMYADDSEGATVNPLVKQIVTNPYHSLEHVEKQQMMASSQQPQATSPQQSAAGSSQKPKTATTQRPKAVNTQKPKTPGAQKSKEDGTQKPKEGEEKSPKPDTPGSLVEFLNKLKISRSANLGPGGRVEEIPDLLPMIPEPPIPNLASIPRPFQPIPPSPGLIGPIETFDFIPGPFDEFGFISGSFRPLPPLPKPDLGFLHPMPPRPSALIPEAPAGLPSTPEPPALLPQMQELSIQLSQTPEPPPLLIQTPEPPPILPQTPELSAPSSPISQPPAPLSSILKSSKPSIRLKSALLKPLPLLPTASESSLPSVPSSMFTSKNSEADVGYDECSGLASAVIAGNKADENSGGAGIGIGIGNINLNDNDEEGATAAPSPLLHTQSRDLNVETLTRDQLLQAIHHLLRTDPSFIKTIHEAYLKSLIESFP